MTHDLRRSLPSRLLVAAKYTLLIGMAIISVYPIVWVFLSAFKSNTEIYTNSFGFPHVWVLSHMEKVIASKTLWSGYYNTLATGACVLVLTLLFGSMTAYVSARRLRGTLLHTYYAFGIMIPMQSILIPTFLVLKSIGLIYTRPGIILCYTASTMPITVFVLHGFMRGLPKEMEEAATIDGCSAARCFFSVILPMSKPGLATVLTLNLLTVWNDYLFSMVIGGSKFYNITVAINNFKGTPENAVNYGAVCSGLVFSILPMILIYILLQENVIKGMCEGAIKA